MEEERGIVLAIVADNADKLQIYVFSTDTSDVNREQLNRHRSHIGFEDTLWLRHTHTHRHSLHIGTLPNNNAREPIGDIAYSRKIDLIKSGSGNLQKSHGHIT